jgi:hypothetical protein
LGHFLPRICVVTSGAFVGLVIPVLAWGQGQQNVDFAALIRTPAGIQAVLERCDGHPQFETALANWLETALPRSQEEREAIRQTSLRLLEDTTDSQHALGLINGLLRHALDDVKRDPAIVPKQQALALYTDIGKAVRRRRSKAKEAALLASVLAEGLTDARQAGFVQEFVNLAESPAPRRVPAVNATLSTRIPAPSGQ